MRARVPNQVSLKNLSPGSFPYPKNGSLISTLMFAVPYLLPSFAPYRAFLFRALIFCLININWRGAPKAERKGYKK